MPIKVLNKTIQKTTTHPAKKEAMLMEKWNMTLERCEWKKKNEKNWKGVKVCKLFFTPYTNLKYKYIE